MNTKPQHSISEDSITVFLDGRVYIVNKERNNFETLKEMLLSPDVLDMSALLGVLDPSIAFQKQLTELATNSLYKESGLTIDANQREITFKGVAIPEDIKNKIFRYISVGLPVDPIFKFIVKLYNNPSKNSVDELFSFLDAAKLPITQDGNFIAYKIIRGDWTDCYTGKFDNSIGAVVEMPRNQVNEDRNQTCSEGLHFCSEHYLPCFGDGFGSGRIVLLSIDPADVVSIPSDYSNAKGRCSKYKVISEVTTLSDNTDVSFGDQVFPTEKEKLLYQEEEINPLVKEFIIRDEEDMYLVRSNLVKGERYLIQIESSDPREMVTYILTDNDGDILFEDEDGEHFYIYPLNLGLYSIKLIS